MVVLDRGRSARHLRHGLLAWQTRKRLTRGKRTCPRCSYNMQGVPGWTCPECGRTANSERDLLRGRWKRRWLLAGVLAILIGSGGTLIPYVRDHGPLGVVPTTLLLMIAPGSNEETLWTSAFLSDPVDWPANGYRRVKWGKTFSQRTQQELANRLAIRTLWDWQVMWMYRKHNIVRVPRYVFEGNPVAVAVRAPYWMAKSTGVQPALPNTSVAKEGPSFTPSFLVGGGDGAIWGLPNDTRSIRFAVFKLDRNQGRTGTLVKAGELEFPLSFVKSASDCLIPVSGAAMDRAVRSLFVADACGSHESGMFETRRARRRGEVEDLFELIPKEATHLLERELHNKGIGAIIELMLDGKMMAQGVWVFRPWRSSSEPVPAAVIQRARQLAPDEAIRAQIVISSDDVAVLDGEYEASYWKGRLDVPLVELLVEMDKAQRARWEQQKNRP